MIQRLIISKGVAGSIGVRSEPRHPALRFRAWRGSPNDRFSAAAGWASRAAAELGAELLDETGRLSEDDCRNLLTAWRTNMATVEQAD